MKKPKNSKSREEISQEQNFERALKKIEVQNNQINDWLLHLSFTSILQSPK